MAGTERMTAAEYKREVIRGWHETKQFTPAVIELAQGHGWLVWHSRTVKIDGGGYATPHAGDKGFPDLVLARDGVVLFRELKATKGRLSPEQKHWGAQIGNAPTDGALWGVWRPQDWLDGTIHNTLT